MYFDTHCHLNFAAFDNDRDTIIKKCLSNNLWMIIVGTNYETSQKAVEIAEKYSQGVFAAVGIHPIHLEETKMDGSELDGQKGFIAKGEDFDYKKFKNLALSSKKVVAIGEIGLDYWHKPKGKEKRARFKEKQKKAFLEQLDLAQELNLPSIIHCRVAHDDLLKILNSKFPARNASRSDAGGQIPDSKIRGVMHGFVGNTEQLEKYLELGLYIGFNGIIFKSIEGINFEENIKKIPLDRILVETDCPYLTPLPAVASVEAGVMPPTRNESLYIKYIIEKIANIRELEYEEVAEITAKNAKKLFRI